MQNLIFHWITIPCAHIYLFIFYNFISSRLLFHTASEEHAHIPLPFFFVLNPFLKHFFVLYLLLCIEGVSGVIHRCSFFYDFWKILLFLNPKYFSPMYYKYNIFVPVTPGFRFHSGVFQKLTVLRKLYKPVFF